MSQAERASIPPPESAAAWVAVLGEAAAIEVFLRLGGASINLSDTPCRSRLAAIVGTERAAALGQTLGAGNTRVPIPKAWIAHVRLAAGVPLQEIARELHVDASTIRRQIIRLREGGGRVVDNRGRDDRQMDLFGG